MIRLPKHVAVGVGLAALIIVAFPLITNHQPLTTEL